MASNVRKTNLSKSVDFFVRKVERSLSKRKRYKELKTLHANLEHDYEYERISKQLNNCIDIHLYPKYGRDASKKLSKVDYIFAKHEPAVLYPKHVNFPPDVVLTTKPVMLYGQKCKGVEINESYIALQQAKIDEYIEANDHSNPKLERAQYERDILLSIKEFYNQILEYKAKKNENEASITALAEETIKRTFSGIIKKHPEIAVHIMKASKIGQLASTCYRLTTPEQTQTVVKKIADEKQF